MLSINDAVPKLTVVAILNGLILNLMLGFDITTVDVIDGNGTSSISILICGVPNAIEDSYEFAYNIEFNLGVPKLFSIVTDSGLTNGIIEKSPIVNEEFTEFTATLKFKFSEPNANVDSTLCA